MAKQVYSSRRPSEGSEKNEEKLNISQHQQEENTIKSTLGTVLGTV